MDPVAASILVSTITSLAEHAPEVAMMLTGTETPEQAIERAHAAVGSVRPLGERIGEAADKRRAELASKAPRDPLAQTAPPTIDPGVAELSELRALRAAIERTHIVREKDGLVVLIARSQTGG